MAAILFGTLDHRQPPVPVPNYPSDGSRRHAANPDRGARLLYRARQKDDLVECIVLAAERRTLSCPKFADHLHPFIRTSATLLERDLQVLELLLEPARANAKDQPTAGKHVQRGV